MKFFKRLGDAFYTCAGAYGDMLGVYTKTKTNMEVMAK
jgi:hypothetical protein